MKGSVKDDSIDMYERVEKCLIDCEKAHEGIGGDFSRLSIYGDALVKLAEAYRAAGDLKAAIGIYKKARAAYFIAACVKPTYHKQVVLIDDIITALLETISSKTTI